MFNDETVEEERLVIFSFYFFVWCTACTYTPRRINPFSWLNLDPEVLVRSKESWTRWIRTQNTIIGNEYPANFIFGFKNRDNTSSSGYEKKKPSVRSKYGYNPCKSAGPTRGTCSRNGSSSRFCVYAPLNAL